MIQMAERLGIALSRLGIAAALAAALLLGSIVAVSQDENPSNLAQQNQDEEDLAVQCEEYDDHASCVLWQQISDATTSGDDTEEE